MKRVINEHKGLAILSLLALVLVIIIGVIFVDLYFGGSKSKYGNRLEGIENVKITDARLESLKAALEDNETVESALCRIQGKIVYIEMTLVGGSTKDNAKNIAASTLEEFEETELDFYDFSYLLRWKATEEGASDTVVAGTKHPYVNSITWTRN